MKWAWTVVAPALVGALAAAGGQPGVESVDARAEVAAALYAASATQAAAERSADAKLRAQRAEIEQLRGETGAGRAANAALRAALTASEEKYVAELAGRDRAYAQEIAVFRDAVQDTASTSEGAAALARFNSGDETGALSILDDLRRGRDAARRKRPDIESASDGRRIALLALQARARGKLSTAQAIARYEEVTRLDPGVHSNWAELAALYRNAGRLPDARRAAERVARTASNDRERASASRELGDVLAAQGDGGGAVDAYLRYYQLAQNLSESNPADSDLQYEVAMAHSRIGNLFAAKQDWEGASTAYGSALVILQSLFVAEPRSVFRQRSLATGMERAGDALMALGDNDEALNLHRGALGIRGLLAEHDPESATAQRDLAVSHEKMGNMLLVTGKLDEGVAEYREELKILKTLTARDGSNWDLQRGASVAYEKIGDGLSAKNERDAAAAAYRDGLAIREAMVKHDGANAGWKRDLLVMLAKIAGVSDDRRYAERGLEAANALEKAGLLEQRDRWILEALKKRLAQ